VTRINISDNALESINCDVRMLDFDNQIGIIIENVLNRYTHARESGQLIFQMMTYLFILSQYSVRKGF
jgi:hypothetical protein